MRWTAYGGQEASVVAQSVARETLFSLLPFSVSIAHPTVEHILLPLFVILMKYKLLLFLLFLQELTSTVFGRSPGIFGGVEGDLKERSTRKALTCQRQSLANGSIFKKCICFGEAGYFCVRRQQMTCASFFSLCLSLVFVSVLCQYLCAGISLRLCEVKKEVSFSSRATI